MIAIHSLDPDKRLKIKYKSLNANRSDLNREHQTTEADREYHQNFLTDFYRSTENSSIPSLFLCNYYFKMKAISDN